MFFTLLLVPPAEHIWNIIRINVAKGQYTDEMFLSLHSQRYHDKTQR